LVGAVVGAVVSAAALRRALRVTLSPELIRVNVSGKPLPVVLGIPLVSGSISGVLAAWAVLVLRAGPVPWRTGLASLVILGALWLAGAWDDRRGDERPRGFAGHLGAARAFRLTGGIVKLLVGGAAGLVAGALLSHGVAVLEVALAVALSANLINLLDRAPGRAGKVGLLGLGLVALLGAAAWTVMAAGLLASVVVVLPADLRERAMLGDAGANPLGGLLGLGLAASLSEAWLVVVLAILLALNLASERWSFSEVIANVRVLDALDRIGRT
jgi:hypothetical protein